MFLSQETSNLAFPMYLALNLMVSGLRNRGRCNFTSCLPNRVNTKKIISENQTPFVPYMQNLSSICQLGAELWTDSHTKVSFAVPLLCKLEMLSHLKPCNYGARIILFLVILLHISIQKNPISIKIKSPVLVDHNLGKQK